jgi:hypothetical protein
MPGCWARGAAAALRNRSSNPEVPDMHATDTAPRTLVRRQQWPHPVHWEQEFALGRPGSTRYRCKGISRPHRPHQIGPRSARRPEILAMPRPTPVREPAGCTSIESVSGSKAGDRATHTTAVEAVTPYSTRALAPRHRLAQKGHYREPVDAGTPSRSMVHWWTTRRQ